MPPEWPRTQNKTSDEHCRYCCAGDKKNSGLVRVGGRQDRIHRWNVTRLPDASYQKELVATDQLTEWIDEMGPCPFCEIGQETEFPSSGFGPWGSQGFWGPYGIDPRGALRPDCQCNVPAMPRHEALAQIHELRRVMVGKMEEIPDEEATRKIRQEEVRQEVADSVAASPPIEPEMADSLL